MNGFGLVVYIVSNYKAVKVEKKVLRKEHGHIKGDTT